MYMNICTYRSQSKFLVLPFLTLIFFVLVGLSFWGLLTGTEMWLVTLKRAGLLHWLWLGSRAHCWCIDLWPTRGYLSGRLVSEQRWVSPENKHDSGKSSFWIGNTPSNGGFSIVMLVFGGVTVSHKLRKTVVQTGGVETMCRISLGKLFFKGSNYSKSIALVIKKP